MFGKKSIGFIIIIVLVLGTIFFFEENEKNDNPNPYEDVVIDNTGGIIDIDNEDSEINGFSIEVPEGAYDEEVNFSISTIDFTVESPDLFNPITPLIQVDNNHQIAVEGMTVSIPIDIDSENEIAMVFYYDQETDTYEAIPTIEYSDTEIKVLTTHFSSIVVSKVNIDDLIDDIRENPLDYNSGFTLGIDDLSFPNEGSALSMGGFCAGSVLFSKWYYDNYKMQKGEEDLYTRFDNDTQGFTKDDSDGIRMVSMVQERMYMTSHVHETYKDSINTTDLQRFLEIAYAIKITKSPQYLEIGTEYKNEDKLLNGHAILATHIIFHGNNEFSIGVYDPNFPAEDKFIHFNAENGFSSYFSSTSINDAGRAYSIILFAGSSALYDLSKMDLYYTQLLNGTIGDDDPGFGKYKYFYYVAEDGEYVPTEITSNFEYTDIAYENSSGSINLTVDAEHNLQFAQFYKNLSLVYSEVFKGISPQYHITKNIELDEGNNRLGLVTYEQNKYYNFDEYVDFTVNYTSNNFGFLHAELLGEYEETARGVNAPEWPENRTLSINSNGFGGMSWYDETEEYSNTFWIVKEVNGQYVLEVAIEYTLYYEDYTYNPDTKELTYMAGTDEFITYSLIEEVYDIEDVNDNAPGIYTFNELAIFGEYDRFHYYGFELHENGLVTFKHVADNEYSPVDYTYSQPIDWRIIEEDGKYYLYMDPYDSNLGTSQADYKFEYNPGSKEITANYLENTYHATYRDLTISNVEYYINFEVYGTDPNTGQTTYNEIYDNISGTYSLNCSNYSNIVKNSYSNIGITILAETGVSTFRLIADYGSGSTQGNTSYGVGSVSFVVGSNDSKQVEIQVQVLVDGEYQTVETITLTINTDYSACS